MDWIPYVFSTTALVVSVLALVGTNNERTRARREVAKSHMSGALRDLEGVMRSMESLRNGWRAHFAVRGVLESGARMKKDQDCDKFAAEATNLKSALDEVSASIEGLSGDALSRQTSRLSDIRVQAASLKSRVDASRAESSVRSEPPKT